MIKKRCSLLGIASIRSWIKNITQHFCRRRVRRLYRVGVYVCGCGSLRVSEPLRYRPDVRATGNKQRRVCMSQTVKRNIRKIGFFDEFCKPTGNSVGMNRFPVPLRE